MNAENSFAITKRLLKAGYSFIPSGGGPDRKAPVIHLGPGVNCLDLNKLLARLTGGTPGGGKEVAATA